MEGKIYFAPSFRGSDHHSGEDVVEEGGSHHGGGQVAEGEKACAS
jgi:hypothetical protein